MLVTPWQARHLTALLSLSFLLLLIARADGHTTQVDAHLNPLAKARKGILTVSVQLTGTTRQDGRVPGTSFATRIDRRLTVQIPMTALGSAPAALLPGAGDPSGASDAGVQQAQDQQAEHQIARLMSGVTEEAVRCDDDDPSCQMSAAMLLNGKLQGRRLDAATKNAPLAGVDAQRFQNWVAARPCAAGGLMRVNDNLDATERDADGAAVPTAYKIRGEAGLPAGREASDAFCDTIFSIDQRTGLYGIRVAGADVSLMLRRIGGHADETWSSRFAEGDGHGDRPLYLTFRGIKAETAALNGEGHVETFAMLHDRWSGTDTPVVAEVTWHFAAD